MEERKPFLDHLEDLRHTLIKIVITLAAAAILSFIAAPKLLAFLKFPLKNVLEALGQAHMEKEVLRSLAPAGAFTLSLKISLFSGLALSLPLCLYYLGQFILPGLTQKERKYIPPLLAGSTGLFLVGGFFSYAFVLPQSLKFLWRYNQFLGIMPLWTIENYISFSLFFLAAFGLVFQAPLVILSLVKLNIVSSLTLRQKRRYAIVAIFIIAAVLTPSPDAFSQILLALPLLLLYELCVWIGTWMDHAPKQAN